MRGACVAIMLYIAAPFSAKAETLRYTVKSPDGEVKMYEPAVGASPVVVHKAPNWVCSIYIEPSADGGVILGNINCAHKTTKWNGEMESTSFACIAPSSTDAPSYAALIRTFEKRLVFLYEGIGKKTRNWTIEITCNP